MARTKQKKIKDVLNLPNVFDVEQDNLELPLKEYFNNQKHFTLEIGCGHGDYTIELGKIYTQRNFIGIDMKGARVYTAAERALELNLINAAFLWGRAEKLADIFPDNSVEQIIIPFPDPHYKRKSISKRLISPEFLSIYKSILRDEGRIHLKTDNNGFYHFALQMIEENDWNIIYSNSNFYKDDPPEFLHNIKTKYEKHYLDEGRTIKYICFGF